METDIQRYRDLDTDRDTYRQRDRDRETRIDRDRLRETETERQTGREIDIETETLTYRETQKIETDRDRAIINPGEHRVCRLTCSTVFQ